MTWIKKKIGPSVHNITTPEEAEKILTTENTVVLGFFDSLVVLSSSCIGSAILIRHGLHSKMQFYSRFICMFFKEWSIFWHPHYQLMRKTCFLFFLVTWMLSSTFLGLSCQIYDSYQERFCQTAFLESCHRTLTYTAGCGKVLTREHTYNDCLLDKWNVEPAFVVC